MENKLSNSFDKSCRLPFGKTLDDLRQDYFIYAQMNGIDDPCIGGLNINTQGRTSDNSSTDKKKERAHDDYLFVLLLNDMRERLGELEARMAEYHELLKAKYGDDVIGGMTDTYLSDEEKSGLTSEHAKLRALADKFLNKDGTIKDEYKGLADAEYIAAWKEAETLRPIVEKYENRQTLTLEEQQEVFETAQNTSLAGNKNMIALSDNTDFKASVDNSLDESRTIQEETVSSIPLIRT